jgi:hypothetical protein
MSAPGRKIFSDFIFFNISELPRGVALLATLTNRDVQGRLETLFGGSNGNSA